MSRRKRPTQPPGRPTAGRRVGRALIVAIVLIFVLILVAGIGIGLLVGGPILLILDYVRKQRFLRRHAGQSFLFVRRKRGWRDFIVNNVAPALPAGVSCIWEDPGEPTSEVAFFIRGRIRRHRYVRRPYLVAISARGRLRVIPMHASLLPLKSQARRSREAQQAVSAIVMNAIGE